MRPREGEDSSATHADCSSRPREGSAGIARPVTMDSEVTVYRAPTSNLPRLSSLKQVAGLAGFVSTVIGTLLALGIIHPFGGTEDALAAAAGKTAEAGSAKMSFEVQGQSDGNPVTLTGDGAYDFRTGRGKVAFHLPPASGSSYGSSTLKSIVDGDTTYLYIPRWDRWIAWDDSAPSDDSQTDLDRFLTLVPDDPAQILESLETGGHVEKVGEESLFGIEATRYRATVDVDELAEQAPADVQRALGAAADGVQEGATLTADVWVDQNGFLRRLVVEGQLGDAGHVAMKVDLYDFGTEVDVKAPPLSKVVDGAMLGL